MKFAANRNELLIYKSLMELEFAKQVIDKFCSNGGKRIVLIGGEPTVYPYFGEIIEYISPYRISIGIASNAVYCQSVLAAVLIEGLWIKQEYHVNIN